KERERMRIDSFESTRFGRAIAEGLRIDQLTAEFEQFRDAKFSMLDLAAFNALSTPSDEYFESLQFAMVENFLELLRAELEGLTQDHASHEELERILSNQLETFTGNIDRYLGETSRSFAPKLRTVLRPVLVFAEQHDLFGLLSTVETL